MKKIRNLGLLLLLVAALSCGKNFGDLNIDPNNPNKVPAEYLLTQAEKNLGYQLTDGQNLLNGGLLFAQYWAQNNYTDESRYLIRPGAVNDSWSWWYATVLYDLREIEKLAPEDQILHPEIANNQVAVAKILEAFCFQHMTDTWGPLPYTEALLADKNRTPKYDTQKDIYFGIIRDLKSAIAQIDVSAEGFGSGDIVYGPGGMARWKQFAHALLLRVAMRMADVEPGMARDLVETYFAGAFASNDDNAVFRWLAGQPNNNPINQHWIDRGDADFGLSNILIDRTLKPLNDPRLPIWADERQGGGGYAGRPYGQNSGHAAGDDISHYSQPSGASAIRGERGFLPYDLVAPTAPTVLMHYAEQCFILAEARERGWTVPGTAESWYNAGITASMQQWGIDDQAVIDAYLAQQDVAYGTAQGPWNQKIGVQKWLALFLQGLDGWTEWRHLDFDKLELPVDGVIQDVGSKPAPVRLTYPTNEQTQNAGGYQQGVLQLGGPDKLSTRLWWDVK